MIAAYLLLTAIIIWLSMGLYAFLYQKYIYNHELSNKDFQLKILRSEITNLYTQLNEERKEKQALILAFFKDKN